MSRKDIVGTSDLEKQKREGTVPEYGGIAFNELEVVQPEQLRTKAQEAKFMEDLVLIQLDKSDKPGAAMFESAGHNGVMQYIKRGEKQVVKRKFLYALIMAQADKIACAFGKNNDGNEFNRVTANRSQTHNIRLLEDRNPEGGMKWFEQVHASV